MELIEAGSCEENDPVLQIDNLLRVLLQGSSAKDPMVGGSWGSFAESSGSGDPNSITFVLQAVHSPKFSMDSGFVVLTGDKRIVTVDRMTLVRKAPQAYLTWLADMVFSKVT
jgi:hypothetical protein